MKSFFGMQFIVDVFQAWKYLSFTGIFSLTEIKSFLRFCICVCRVKRDELNESFRDFLFGVDLRCFAAGSLQEEDLSEGQGKHSLGPTCSAPLAVQWTLCTTIGVHHCCCCTPLLVYTTAHHLGQLAVSVHHLLTLTANNSILQRALYTKMSLSVITLLILSLISFWWY